MNNLHSQAAATPLEDSTTRLIPLTQGKFAIVDAADFHWLIQWKWFAHYQKKRDKWYAARSTYDGVHVGRVYMHRAIMEAQPVFQVDHKDGDGLNNRRSSNLRLATNQQNNFNKKGRKDNTSGYRGVWWHKAANKWASAIMLNQKSVYLGHFVDPRDASAAYEAAAKKAFGEFYREPHK